MYVTDQDLFEMRRVKDLEVKEVFDEALEHDPSLILSEVSQTSKSWVGKGKTITRFTIYHECFNSLGEKVYQARQQISATGDKKVVIAYLYGIINGSLCAARLKQAN